MAPTASSIEVEVVYALPLEQRLLKVRVDAGATVLEAIRASGVLDVYPDIDPAQADVGVFGKRVTLDTLLRAGDRVEIYRRLTIDPKEARRQRGKKR